MSNLSFTLSPWGDGNTFLHPDNKKPKYSFLYTFPVRGWKHSAIRYVQISAKLSFTLSPWGDGNLPLSCHLSFLFQEYFPLHFPREGMETPISLNTGSFNNPHLSFTLSPWGDGNSSGSTWAHFLMLLSFTLSPWGDGNKFYFSHNSREIVYLSFTLSPWGDGNGRN